MSLGEFTPNSGNSRIFDAAYPGRCEACGAGIWEGDEVCYEDDVLIHAECRSEA